MRVEQALVAVGGRASRLKADGVEVPATKSLLMVENTPLLSWCLQSLCLAGVKRIVLAGNEENHLTKAQAIAESLPSQFKEVTYFQDEGLGVHGLPYHAKHLLGYEFFFECGHGISKPAHYRKMDAQKSENTVVFSAFTAHHLNLRQPVTIKDGELALAAVDSKDGFAIAHPMLIDQTYTENLPSLGFDIQRIIGHYSTTRQLEYVWNDMPPEFDIADEYQVAQKMYATFKTELS